MHRPIRRRIVPAAAVLLAVGAAPALSAPGDISIASLSSGGAVGAEPAEASSVSADGRLVAFTSKAPLTGTPTGGKVQLFVRDRTSGTTVLASASAAGAPADADVEVDGGLQSPEFAVSGDGRYVVFASDAANLTPADTDGLRDVFRKDLQTGAVELISVSSAEVKANAAVQGNPDVSYDGERVVFGSGAATNLFSPDENAATSDIVVRDVRAGTTLLAARDSAGTQSNGTTERPAISQDGRFVVFTANNVSNLYVGDDATNNDSVVHDLLTRTTVPASDKSKGTNFPDISGDGRFVVHEVDGQVFRREVTTGLDVLISAKDGTAVAGNGNARRPAISADGTRTAFSSTSTDLLAADGNAATEDVFVRTDATTTAFASIRADGTTQGSNASTAPAIAGNGGLATFTFDDSGAVTTLVPATDTNAKPDVHAKELAPTDTTGPSLTLSGPADGASTADAQVTVAGSASDASGVGALTVGGTAVTLGDGGAFSQAVALAPGANTLTVVATDGSGNRTTRSVSVTRTVPATTTPPPAGPPPSGTRPVSASGLAVTVGRTRVVTRVTLSGAARVRATLQRRVVVRVGKRPGRRKVVFRLVKGPVVRDLAAGAGQVVFTTRSRLAAGRYRVRLVLTNTAGTTVATKAFRVRPPARRA